LAQYIVTAVEIAPLSKKWKGVSDHRQLAAAALAGKKLFGTKAAWPRN
jgi:hypothetical protein